MEIEKVEVEWEWIKPRGRRYPLRKIEWIKI